MPDKRLDQLFANPSFLNDLPEIVNLPPHALNLVSAIIARGTDGSGEPFTDDDAGEVALTADVPKEAVAAALALSAFVAILFYEERVTVDEVYDRMARAVQDPKGVPRSFRDHLQRIYEARQTLGTTRERRQLLQDGGKTVHIINVVTDLRVRSEYTAIDGDDEDSAPEIIELLPLTTVKISFAHVDDGDDVTFQLSPSELRKFIRQLQVAEMELYALKQRISLNPSQTKA